MSAIYFINNTINNYVEDFTDEVALPVLAKGYHALTYIPRRLFDLTTHRSDGWVTRAVYGPISCEAALKLTVPIELFSSWIGCCKPIQVSGLEYVTKSVISLFQHLHIEMREMGHLLKIPQNLKHFISRFKSGILPVRRVALFTLHIWIKISYFAINYFTNYQSRVLGFLSRIVQEARNETQSTFVRLSHRAIDKQERLLQKSATEAVAASTFIWVSNTFVTLGLKVALGASVFFATKQLVVEKGVITGEVMDYLGATIAAVITLYNTKLWLDPYYEAYNPYFDPRKSEMMQYCEKYFGLKYYPIIRYLGAFK